MRLLLLASEAKRKTNLMETTRNAMISDYPAKLSLR